MQQSSKQQQTDHVDCTIAPSRVVAYRKAHLRVAEILFDAKCPNTVNTDVLRYKCRATPISGFHCAKTYTLCINLKDDPKKLLANMRETTRYEIRRAQRERVRYEFTATPAISQVEQFFEFYDSFAQSKKLRPSVDRSRVLGLLHQGMLDLSTVSSPDGSVLVWHAHIRAGRHACLLYSASLFRREATSMAAYLGRANRMHHWSDMLRFRDEGFAIYDFGGWYPGAQDESLLRINRFKEGFGGELAVQYNCDQGVTWRGALILWLARIRRMQAKLATVGSAAFDRVVSFTV
jgi:hypothetical protein